MSGPTSAKEMIQHPDPMKGPLTRAPWQVLAIGVAIGLGIAGIAVGIYWSGAFNTTPQAGVETHYVLSETSYSANIVVNASADEGIWIHDVALNASGIEPRSNVTVAYSVTSTHPLPLTLIIGNTTKIVNGTSGNLSFKNWIVPYFNLEVAPYSDVPLVAIYVSIALGAVTSSEIIGAAI